MKTTFSKFQTFLAVAAAAMPLVHTLVFAAAILAAAPMLHAAIVLDAPGHVYTDRERPTAFGGAPGATYELTDWRGQAVDAPGATGVFGERGFAMLPRLPTGYYHLKSGEEDATFAVVPVPESRVFDHDSFYGIDSAQSWVSRPGQFRCPWNGGDTYRTVSDLIWRTGLPHVRERLRWGEVNPTTNAYNYSYYMYNADMLRARGILVSGMFHDAASWAGRKIKLPANLYAIHDFCAHTAAAFGDRMGDWEFWNEEDIHFAPEPAWYYAATLKAAYLGFKAGKPDCTVLNGALLYMPDNTYARCLFDNDAGKFFDVYNQHVYSSIASFPGSFASLRSFMGRYGLGDRAVWITESGTRMEGMSKSDGAMKGQKAHSPDQELVLAEYYAKSQVAFQMEGVSRNYFFVFGAYNENDGAKDWGVMRRDGTVKPIYAAISAMTRELVSARLVGTMNVGKELRAYVFEQPDGSQTLMFWSVSPVDTAGSGVVATPDFARPLELAVSNGTYRVSDLCGVCSSATVTNGVLSLESTRFPTYVAGLRGLAATKPARPRGKVMPYVPTADEDLSVIVSVDLDKQDFQVSGQKSRAYLKNDTGRMRVQVWNMGDAAKTGRVEVAGCTVEGLPETLDLGPRGMPPAAFDCKLMPSASGETNLTLVLTGVFNGKRSSKLVVPVQWQK